MSPLVYNFPDGSFEQVPPTDPRARRFRAAVNVDDAIQWINDRPAGQPWMATVSFCLGPHPAHAAAGRTRRSRATWRAATSTAPMSTAQRGAVEPDDRVDRRRGRPPAGGDRPGPAGPATSGLVYSPRRTDTMVIVVGDNGSLGSTVKPPFDGSRAKGTAYQTGVWVPLIVAGPLVNGPDRVVSHMVNIADLYALFGEIAGIEDVRRAVPRPIDAAPMLPYLVNPEPGSDPRVELHPGRHQPAGERRRQRSLHHQLLLHADSRHEERLRGQRRHLVGRRPRRAGDQGVPPRASRTAAR